LRCGAQNFGVRHLTAIDMAQTQSSAPNPEPVDDMTMSPIRAFARDLWTGLRLRPIQNLSIIALVTIAVILLGYGSKRLSSIRHIRIPSANLLRQAMSALDANRLEEARVVASELRLYDDIPEQDRGIPPYVLGVVMHQDAVQMEANADGNPREKKALHSMAARYLEEAQHAGFPPGRETHGKFLLGKSLHDCGRFADALPYLLDVAEAESSLATESCRLLTNCYLHHSIHDLEKASLYNSRYLADSTLSPEQRDAALLSQAKILFELQRGPECQQLLDSIDEHSPIFGHTRLLAGQLMLREGDALKASLGSPPDSARSAAMVAKYQAAAELFRKAQAEGDRTSEFQRQVQFLLGLALRRAGDSNAAIQLFSRTQRAHLDSPEGIASGWEEADLQHEMGNDADALQVYGHTIRQASHMKMMGEPWVTPDDVRQRIERTFQVYRDEEKYPQAAELIKALALLFPDARNTQMQARLHESWAKDLMNQIRAIPANDQSSLMTQARLEHRQAGMLFEQLARQRFSTREYESDLWNSGENYLSGQDYVSAAKVYRRFLTSETRSGRAAALVRLGEALLALNKPADALRSLNDCIETYPKDPFVYGARLTAAEANLENGDIPRAKELLVANLENGSLTPQSREWRESLYLLGRILFREGMNYETQSRIKGIDSNNPAEQQEGLKELRLAQTAFLDCSLRLSEALQREPDAPHANDARYMLAQAHLQSAKLPKKELAFANIEATRGGLRRDMQQELTAAAAAFDELKRQLAAKQETQSLNEIEERMLRNCYFGRADALYDLDQYEEAIQAYASATNRYQHEPEALEAYIQIANCHRKLRRPDDSRRTLEQAKLVLNRIRPEADFLVTTRYNRQEWNDLLDWLSTL
jgi:TolA-binding protein